MVRDAVKLATASVVFRTFSVDGEGLSGRGAGTGLVGRGGVRRHETIGSCAGSVGACAGTDGPRGEACIVVASFTYKRYKATLVLS